VDFLVGGRVRLVGVTERVGGNVAREMEPQLRAQLPRGAGLAGREDELDVGTTSRLEVELLADGGLDALLTRLAVVGAQHVHDAAAEVVARCRAETGLTEQEAPCG